jgi:hypothetical protein
LEFSCLGHQSWQENTGPLLTKYPELDLTPGAFPENEGIYCRAWDLLNPKVNEIVFALMDELIDAFQPDAFHVGMDATLELTKYSKTQNSPLVSGHLFTTWSVTKDDLTHDPPIVEGMKVLQK